MTLQINLPDDVRARLQRRAVESGYESVERFAEALLLSEVSEAVLPERVEQELLRRIDDPAPLLTLDEVKADLSKKLGRAVR